MSGLFGKSEPAPPPAPVAEKKKDEPPREVQPNVPIVTDEEVQKNDAKTKAALSGPQALDIPIGGPGARQTIAGGGGLVGTLG